MSQASLLEHFVKFKAEPCVESRALMTRTICEQFNNNEFRQQEQDIVKEIIGYLSFDIEKTIRKALAETLRENDGLPHDVALRLAGDDTDIAVNILEYSNVLTDNDLVMIIKSAANAIKLSAIARRRKLSERISAKLVETRNKKVVSAVLENQGADISALSLRKVCDFFNGEEDVLEIVIDRGGLPIELAHKLVKTVSENLREKLAIMYNITPLALKTNFQTAEEKVILGIIAENADKKGVTEVVNNLYAAGKLSQSIVLRALCRADLDFFEAGTAKLAGVPAANAKKLLYSGDPKGFEALLTAAEMPKTMIKAAGTLLRIILNNRPQEHDTKQSYSKKLAECIMSEGYEHKVPNMRYLLTLVGSNAYSNHKSL